MQLALLWGKTDRSGESRHAGGALWHPVLCHAIDTTEVARALIERRLPVEHVAHLTAAAGGTERAREVVALLCGLHDVPGKVTLGFVNAWRDTNGRDPALDAAREDWRAEATRAGLPLDPPADLPEGRRFVGHAHLTYAYLPDVLRSIWPNLPTVEITEWARVLGGHHAEVPGPPGRRLRTPGDGTGVWDDLRRDVVRELLGLYAVSDTDLARLSCPEGPACAVLYALVVTSDWIASNAALFPYAGMVTDLSAYRELARTRAAEALDRLHLDRWDPGAFSWSSSFPAIRSPHLVQQAVTSTVQGALDSNPDRPGMLVIVEADTGSGKTEAALAAAQQIAHQQGHAGLYMALPTRASADMIVPRISSFAERTSTKGPAWARTATVHGTASVNALIRQAREQAASDQANSTFTAPTNTCQDCADGDADRFADSWYLGSRRGLLSPVGVGTVDQIVLAAQRHKHWLLRAGAALQQVVIIDEMHAYDTYQTAFLEQYVRMAASVGAAVIILSATIPSTTVTGLVQAWRDGVGHDTLTDEPAPGVYPRVTVVDGDGRLHGGRALPPEAARTRSTLVRLRPAGEPDADLVAAVLNRIRDAGDRGNVLVVVNTVRKAVALTKEFERAGPGVDVWMLHSRFRASRRAELEELLKERYGPDGPARPDASVVVATQVAEQSLDVDFDLVVTALAPIDLILQRRGRGHRHHRPSRNLPDELWVTMPSVENGIPVIHQRDDRDRYRNIDAYVYDADTLLATWIVLDAAAPTGTFTLTTPADTSHMIEAVYRDTPDPRWPGPLAAAWQEAHDECKAERDNARLLALPQQLANPVRWRPKDLAVGPQPDAEEDRGTGNGSARSRLGEPSDDVIVLFRTEGTGLALEPDGTPDPRLERLDQLERAERDLLIADMLGNTVTVRSALLHGVVEEPPAAWSRTPLRRHRKLVVDRGGQVRGIDPQRRLSYTDRYGLI